VCYVEDNLNVNESVLHRATLHWIIYLPGILLLLLGLLFLWPIFRTHNLPRPVLGIIWSLALIQLFSAFIRGWATEMAVTNRRVILKTGLISRRTIELNLDKVENVSIDQTVLGRILGFGSMTVVGTGGSRETFSVVAKPLLFRKAVQAQSGK